MRHSKRASLSVVLATGVVLASVPAAARTTTPVGRATTPLVIRNIHLDQAQPVDDSPAATLSFDVHNEGDSTMQDIVLGVSIREHTDGRAEPDGDRVKPFKILSHEVLQSGYSLHFELLLRNLSVECDCVPAVDVVDATATPQLPSPE